MIEELIYEKGIKPNKHTLEMQKLYYNAKDNRLYTIGKFGELLYVGGPINGIFYENDSIISSSYTITTGKNAMSAGPITMADGVTVTIPDGSTWTVV